MLFIHFICFSLKITWCTTYFKHFQTFIWLILWRTTSTFVFNNDEIWMKLSPNANIFCHTPWVVRLSYNKVFIFYTEQRNHTLLRSVSYTQQMISCTDTYRSHFTPSSRIALNKRIKSYNIRWFCPKFISR